MLKGWLGLTVVIFFCALPACLALPEVRTLLVSEPRLANILLRSLALAGLVTLLAVPLGGLFGLAASSSRSRSLAGLLPLSLPPTVAAVAWLSLLGQAGISPAGWPWLVAAQVLAFFPLVGLTVWVGARQLQPDLEEAGEIARGPRGTLLGVTLPLLSPYLALGALLVALFALQDAALPSLFQVHVLAVEVNTSLGTFLDPARAAKLAALPALLLLVGVWLLGLSGRAPQAFVPYPRTRPWSNLLSLLVLLSAATPLAWLLLSSLQPEAWRLALELGSADLLRSLAQSLAVALLTTTVGFALASTTRAGLFLFGSLLALALPPALLLQAWRGWLTDGPVLALTVFSGRYLAFPLALTMLRRAQLPRDLEDSARLLAPLRRLPLALGFYAPALLASFTLVYLLSMADLSTHLLADPPGWGSLIVRIFSLAHYQRMDVLAVLCLAQVALLTLPLVWLRGRP